MSAPAYRDPLGGLRARIAQLEADLAPRVERLGRLRRYAVRPELRAPLDASVREDDDARRLGALVQRLEARAHDVEVAIARTDGAIAHLGFPGVTLQDEMLGDRAVPAEQMAGVAKASPSDVQVLAQATVARFRHRDVPFVFAAGMGHGVVCARLAIAVPRELPAVVGWPWDGLDIDGARWSPTPIFMEWTNPPRSTFWMSHGRAVIAFETSELAMPGDGIRTLVELREALAEAW